ncbi:MAG TPA: CopD family protein [Acidimicrobiales bacterium]|nr:CopD family protein [Acidimicrobiales bacterium]
MGLALWVGVVGLFSVARRAGVDAAKLLRVGRFAPGLALAGTVASVVSLALVTSGSVRDIGQVLSGGESGQLRAMEAVVALVGVIVPARLREVHAPLVALAVVAEAASGHAAASAAPGLATVSFAIHLGAVGVWVFAIVAALLAPSARRLLRALWPHAVGAAVVVALTGALNATLELSGPRDLISTGYGRTVLAKVGLIIAMAALGLCHQLRHRRASVPEVALRRPLRLELVAAGLALVAATALVGFPNPPREAEATARAAGTDPVLADLASHDALSLAEASGSFVVGLTVLPPRPGPVELRVHVVGVDAGEALTNAVVHLSGPGADGDGASAVGLKPCGAGCFRGRTRVERAGTWSFAFSASSTRGPVEARFAAPLPAPDGTSTLEDAMAALGRLRSMAMREEIRGASAGPVTIVRYRFSAPDAFEFRVRDGHQLVIDNRRYDRSAPGKPWETGAWPGVPFRWPRGYYQTVWDDRVAVRILGTENVDGMRTTVISFVRPELPAWFRLWVGDDGLVRREEMRAEGHLMSRTYNEFNESPMLAPPADGP